MANPLITTARSLTGNPRACVYTEPLWGLSMMLCLPYASVYMLALGISDIQLGFITTIGTLSQMVFALLGGIINDKLGRRWTTAVVDFIAWCIPCLIWVGASLVDPRWAFWLFLGASVVNGTLKVTQNAWDCLMVEDARRGHITGIYTLVILAGQMSAIFAPIASVLVAQYSLVPAVRILYINAFIVMTGKIFWLYLWSHETQMGLVRRQATRGQSVISLLKGYGGVIRLVLASPGTIFSLIVAIIAAAVNTINNTFWQVITAGKLMVPTPLLPIFAMGRSVIAMVFLFLVVPRLTRSVNLKVPLLVGFAAYLVGQVLLASIPGPATGTAGVPTYALLCLSLVFDGFGMGIVATLAESLVALNVDKQERSRVMAVQHALIMLAVSPFGWIGGALSDISRSLPFVMTAVVLLAGVGLTLRHYARHPGEPGRA
jgi:MFS family permease